MGGNITEANQLTGRKKSQWSVNLLEFQSFQVDAKGGMSLGGRQSVLPPQMSTLSQTDIKSV